ncbi:helix-turn-helix domain-containing protein [Paraburkholderia nemoris]|uniref:helix-turn-helix domain-containing protein n=1 Tax=Paraburkholderia nemoris TaxID=2793076 RepID=UPI001F3D9A62|nr:XRE family transcriptional regulator [Paraburkholderia nemoris]
MNCSFTEGAMPKSQNQPPAGESPDIEVAEKQIDPAVEKVSRALSAQIHAFRTSAGIASGTLAKMAGISHSMLSRIEKGTATPSIETLTRLANALGKPVSRFFVDQSERHDCSFVPTGQGVTVDREGSSYGHIYRLVGHVLSGNLSVEPYVVTLDEKSQPWSTHQTTGIQFLHVLEGTMKYRYANRLYDLKPGDSLLFDPNAAHGPEEIESVPVKFLAVFFNIREYS